MNAADALANFLRSVSDACLTFATELEKGINAAVPVDNVELPLGRGQRQQQILELPQLANETGLKTADIAA